jgi:ribose 5-phosphate isomerase B
MADRVQDLSAPQAQALGSSGVYFLAEDAGQGKEMLILLGADHGGFEMRECVAEYLRKRGHEVEEFGPSKAGERNDYPDTAAEVCERLLEEEESGRAVRAMLFCGTGIGMSIAANKIPGIRCALVHDHYEAIMCRQHNDANVMALGGRVLGLEIAKGLAYVFITTEFAGQHHTARLEKIAGIERKHQQG